MLDTSPLQSSGNLRHVTNRLHRTTWTPPATDNGSTPNEGPPVLAIDKTVIIDGEQVDRSGEFVLDAFSSAVLLEFWGGAIDGVSDAKRYWTFLNQVMSDEVWADFKAWCAAAQVYDMNELIFYVDQMIEAVSARPTQGQPPSAGGLPETQTGSTDGGAPEPATGEGQGSAL